jgi:hypothetical protein
VGKIVEGSGFVGIELVHDDPDAVRIRVVNVGEFNHAVDPLRRPPLCSDFDIAVGLAAMNRREPSLCVWFPRGVDGL